MDFTAEIVTEYHSDTAFEFSDEQVKWTNQVLFIYLKKKKPKHDTIHNLLIEFL